MTIRELVKRNRVRMKSERVSSNPNMPDMPRGSSHWKCTIRGKDRCMIVYFSQGPAIPTEPDVVDVMACLAMDASHFENTSDIDEWAAELGIDKPSRAIATWKACEEARDDLQRVFGDDYEDLIGAEEE